MNYLVALIWQILYIEAYVREINKLGWVRQLCVGKHDTLYCRRAVFMVRAAGPDSSHINLWSPPFSVMSHG